MPDDDDDESFPIRPLGDALGIGALPKMEIPDFAPREMKLKIFAETTFDTIRAAIEDFQETLKPDEEVAACLAHFGHWITISISSVGFRDPYLITFAGVDDKGRRCELVQHMSQVNLLLVAVPAKEKPARRIGFEHTGGSADQT